MADIVGGDDDVLEVRECYYYEARAVHPLHVGQTLLVATRALTNCVPRFCFLFWLILFFVFFEYIYRCGCYYYWSFSLVSKWVSTLR